MGILGRIAAGLAVAALCFTFAACGSIDDSSKSEDKTKSAAEISSAEDSKTQLGTFTITLYPEYAPITCENFEKLVNDGFYNGLTFHRVVEDFMAQGGDPNGNGTGGSDSNIKGEFLQNGVDNKLSHTRGVVSMARSQDPDSASSQFFICYTDDCSFLDGQYAAFGKVTEGMEVVDSFLNVERVTGTDGAISSPTTPIVIKEAKMIDDDVDGNPRATFEMVLGDS
jgi:peptidyl-prolyl cis-trans isomerase B (cyclophilin B)